MFSQVYCHPVRRIYDIHLKDFLKKWLKNGQFSTKTVDHLGMTDIEVLNAMRQINSDVGHPAHIDAKRIIERGHFKLLYTRNPNDMKINLSPGTAIYEAACKKYGAEVVRHDAYNQKGGSQIFPVYSKDGRILQSIELSDTLLKVPVVVSDFVFIDRKVWPDAIKWLEEKREEILKPNAEKEE
jgi:HD superfamily phosphohydrolase